MTERWEGQQMGGWGLLGAHLSEADVATKRQHQGTKGQSLARQMSTFDAVSVNIMCIHCVPQSVKAGHLFKTIAF